MKAMLKNRLSAEFQQILDSWADANINIQGLSSEGRGSALNEFKRHLRAVHPEHAKTTLTTINIRNAVARAKVRARSGLTIKPRAAAKKSVVTVRSPNKARAFTLSLKQGAAVSAFIEINAEAISRMTIEDATKFVNDGVANAIAPHIATKDMVSGWISEHGILLKGRLRDNKSRATYRISELAEANLWIVKNLRRLALQLGFDLIEPERADEVQDIITSLLPGNIR